MKRKSIIFLGLILLVMLSLPLTILAKEQTYDFRQTNWGMSKDQVKATEESSKLVEEDIIKRYDGSLHYKGEVDGLDCEVYYYFTKGRFVAAAYEKRSDIQFKNEYINNYKKLKAYLIKRYGRPKEEGIEMIKDEPLAPFALVSWDHPTPNGAQILLILLKVEDKNEIEWSINYQSEEGLEIVEKEDIALKQSKQQYDFRQTNWGMSKEQVKATEDKKPDFEADTMLGYDVTISGKDFTCIYSFLEDKLYNSGYFFTGKHTNKNLYIDDYEELKETLTKKYGKPKTDIPGLWKNDLYKDDKSHWGMAISVGHLTYGASWETSTTEIYLMLSGDNYEISLILTYDSKELREWVKQTEEKKAKSNF